jgi:hypothetical protein
MGVSTDGQICFGILLPDEENLPWGEEDCKKWWREVNGYTPPFQIYDKYGDYIDGQKPKENIIDEYYKHQREWENLHPLPVELVNVCSGDYPMYIVAVPSSVSSARRGYPEAFNPDACKVSENEITSLIEFVRKYFPDLQFNNPQWYLSSYWG